MIMCEVLLFLVKRSNQSCNAALCAISHRAQLVLGGWFGKFGEFKSLV